MKITFEIDRATVLIRKSGTDIIDLYVTGLPSPFPSLDQQASFTMQTYRGNGAEYVRNNFGLEPVIIDAN